MKRYDHANLEEHWEYKSGIDSEHSYSILSNIYDLEVFEGIMNHALRLQKKPFEEINIFIDTWRIDCPNCRTCSLTNIKLIGERNKRSSYYYEKGIRSYEFF